MDELFREDREIEKQGKTGTDGDEPLALKLAPKSLGEFYGQEKVIG
jgi:replication-associated recombination protein RarA